MFRFCSITIASFSPLVPNLRAISKSLVACKKSCWSLPLATSIPISGLLKVTSTASIDFLALVTAASCNLDSIVAIFSAISTFKP